MEKVDRVNTKKMDRAWTFSFFGTAIGSGILFIPLQAGKSGIYMSVVTMALAFSVTYFAQKYYAVMIVKAENAESYNDVIQEFCGKGFSVFISYFFVIQLFASVLVYTTGLNANIGEFLHKYNITPVNLSGYKIFPLIIIVALTIILMCSEKTIVKALDKLSIVLIILIAVMMVLFIPFWHIVEFKNFGGSTHNIVKNFLMSFPLYMGAVNFYPTLSPMVMYYRENYDMSNDDVERKAISLNKSAIYLLALFTGLFVLSSALTLTPESLSYALKNNLSSLAVVGFDQVSASLVLNIIKFLSYIVIFFALISSFYGLMLAVVEIVAARLYPSHLKVQVRRKFGVVIVMFFLWVFTTFNLNILGILGLITVPATGLTLFIIPTLIIFFNKKFKKYRSFMTAIVLAFGIFNVFSYLIGLLM